MREIRMTDGEVQALIAPAMRRKLVAAGFHTGGTNDGDRDGPCAFYFPINLDLAGDVEVIRGEDGIWTFRQEDNAVLADRTAQSLQSHAAAIVAAEAAWKGT